MKPISIRLGIEILLILWAFSDINAKDVENHDPAPQSSIADSLYRASVESLDSESIEQSIEAFKRVLKADHQYAPAHYRLSLLYSALNTVNDRQRANQALKEAIRLDPDNIDYQLALGDLLWQQKFWSRAEAQYRKAFQSDALNAEAAYQIGSRALDSYLKYKYQQHLDLLDKSYVLFYWNNFSTRDLDRAITFLDRATQINPTHRNAYYRLGLAYYESNRPGQLIQVCARLLKHIPDDKDTLLFMALGFQAINQLDRANKLFTEALKRMSPDERTIMESLDGVADTETQQQIQKAEIGLVDNSQAWTDSDARTLFWQKQDPLYLTDYNERRMAHYGRVAYANLRYNQPEHNMPGYRTDMGRAYIRYGRPLNSRIKRGDMETPALDKQGIPKADILTNADFQTETWTYEGFRLQFVQADGYNGKLISSMPNKSRYIDPYIRTKYNTPHQILAFKEPDGLRLEIAYALPAERFNAQTTTVADGLFIFDPNGREIDRHARQTSVSWPQSEHRSDQHQIISHQMHLSPGTYDILVESYNQKTGQIATFRETRNLTIPDSSLAMSDLFLAQSVQEKTPFPESHHDLSILPNPTRTYDLRDPVYIYLEVYNLKRNEFGRTRFDITYHISIPDKEEINPALFIDQDLARLVTVETFLNEITQRSPEREDGIENENDIEDSEHRLTDSNILHQVSVESRVKYLLPKSRETEQLKIAAQEGVAMTTSVTAEYEGDRVDDFTYLQLDVSQLPKGIHKLTLTILDRFANIQIQRETLFRVAE